jgi:hypothetical protein
VAFVRQGVRQFFFLSGPEVTLVGGQKNRRARFHGIPEAFHAISREHHLRLHGQRTVASQLQQLLHQVGMHQSRTNERRGIGQGMHGNQQDSGIQSRSQNRRLFQGHGSGFFARERHHHFQLGSRFTPGQVLGVQAKLTACLHISTLRARA